MVPLFTDAVDLLHMFVSDSILVDFAVLFCKEVKSKIYEKFKKYIFDVQNLRNSVRPSLQGYANHVLLCCYSAAVRSRSAG